MLSNLALRSNNSGAQYTLEHYEVEKTPTNRPTDVDNLFRDNLIDFYATHFQLCLSEEEAIYIIVHRFESFSQAFNRYNETTSNEYREALLKIADAAIRYCTPKR